MTHAGRTKKIAQIADMLNDAAQALRGIYRFDENDDIESALMDIREAVGKVEIALNIEAACDILDKEAFDEMFMFMAGVGLNGVGDKHPLMNPRGGYDSISETAAAKMISRLMADNEFMGLVKMTYKAWIRRKAAETAADKNDINPDDLSRSHGYFKRENGEAVAYIQAPRYWIENRSEAERRRNPNKPYEFYRVKDISGNGTEFEVTAKSTGKTKRVSYKQITRGRVSCSDFEYYEMHRGEFDEGWGL